MNIATPPEFLPLVMGIPDNRQIPVTAGPDGGFGFGMVGNTRIVTHLPPQVQQKLVRVFCEPDLPVRIPASLRETPIINAIADPDIAANALGSLAAHVEQTGAACFNHPLAVLGSGRDRVAIKLANVPGLHVPRTLRLRIEEPADLVRAVKENGLSWPLIVRLPGSHVGQDTIRIDSPPQVLHSLRELPWGGHDLYVTEYVDFRDPDGLYRKIRYMIAGTRVLQIHIIRSDGWMVHAKDRKPEDAEWENGELRAFEGNPPESILTTLRAIADAMDLDYFGVDCSLRPDGRLLVFEVNAMMDALNRVWDPPLPAGVIEAGDLLEEVVCALLFDPTRWRHPGSAVSPHG